jgi:hypothetical protein
MNELIACACGHGISSHSSLGCGDDHPRKCRCRETSTGLLERAVQSARVRYDGVATANATAAPTIRT